MISERGRSAAGFAPGRGIGMALEALIVREVSAMGASVGIRFGHIADAGALLSFVTGTADNSSI